MRVYPMRAPANGVVIAHQDITESMLDLIERKKAEECCAPARSASAC